MESGILGCAILIGMYEGIKLEEQIRRYHYHPDMPKNKKGHFLPKLQNVIEDEILKRLKACGYNRTITAMSLGIAIRTVRNWIRRLRVKGHRIPDDPLYIHPKRSSLVSKARH